MLWVIYATDRPGSARIRAELRERRAHPLTASTLRVILRGPLLEDTDPPSGSGSLLIVEAADREEVESFVRAHPFYESGVWREVRIHSFTREDAEAAAAAE